MTINLEDRYSRQELFAPIGPEGQKRIRAARVLLTGCGGLGTVIADIMARAGVGLLRIVDRDVVELSNLQRQSLFGEEDVRERRPKAEAAARRLATINSDIAVEPIVAEIKPENILGLLDGIDIVIDGLDNLETRYVLNDACVKRGVPWVHGACAGSYGLAALVVPGKTPCLRCLFREPPEKGVALTCNMVGIVAPIAHVVASLQCARALRWLATGSVEECGGLFAVDVWDVRCDGLGGARAAPDPDCPCCGKRNFEFL